MRVISFFKMFKVCCRFKKKLRQKLRKFFFYCLDNGIWIGCLKFSLLQREYLPLALSVLRNSHKIHIVKRETFSNSISLRVMYNYDKMMPCRIHQCLGPFSMLTIEGCSDTGLSAHLSTMCFGIRNSGNTWAMRVIFFFFFFLTKYL